MSAARLHEGATLQLVLVEPLRVRYFLARIEHVEVHADRVSYSYTPLDQGELQPGTAEEWHQSARRPAFGVHVCNEWAGVSFSYVEDREAA